ncbi:hypothetical protein BH18CHL2_BH18CHL2_07510 [soil metagenome]
MSELTPQARAFLEEPRFGVLATIAADGGPHQTVMWYLLDGDEFVFNTAVGRAKARYLARDPRVSLLVEDGYRYVRVSGRAREVPDAETGQADIRRLAIRYHGAEHAEELMRERYSKQLRISYRFRITGVHVREV